MERGNLKLASASMHHTGSWWRKEMHTSRVHTNKDACHIYRQQLGCKDATRPVQGCNVYHVGPKTTLHVSLDLINPDIHIVANGSATTQCQGVHDFSAIPIAIAKEAAAERLTSLRALAFDSGEKLVGSLGLACVAQLKCQLLQCGAQHFKFSRGRSSSNQKVQAQQ